MGLDGPSRTIIYDPVEQPTQEPPLTVPAPEAEPEPVAVPEREPVPA